MISAADSHVATDDIRTAFSQAMSEMYRREVPQYGTLLELVSEINAGVLRQDPALEARLRAVDQLSRISEERHGAIRLGTAAELATMRRLFAVMGMVPVGYYDLSEAGIPVHSTAFRPLTDQALRRNPFRVFTSLLRLDLIADAGLRAEAEAVLSRRDIFTPGARALVERHELQGGLSQHDAEQFVREALETFRWHRTATVDRATYDRLHDAHRLIADVVSFRGPHINHLTPRTLDIDAVQQEMPARGITPKAVVEGPPRRRCPILLRQTSFKALEEPLDFIDRDRTESRGTHTARFGEIEQRGAALTPRGRALFDRMLAEVRDSIAPQADGSNAEAYMDKLETVFAEFPDNWNTLRRERLAYFTYRLTEQGVRHANGMGNRALRGGESPLRNWAEEWIADGLLAADPITYEDFLPVSAAGIFQSNLGDQTQQDVSLDPNQAAFERDLGISVADPFAHYEALEAESLARIAPSLS